MRQNLFGFYPYALRQLAALHITLVFERSFVKRFGLGPMIWDRCPVCLSVCNVGALRPDGWMDQDATWYVGQRLGPGRIVLMGIPAPPSAKGARQPPLFGPCLLWPNGWMDQDATWYNRRPQPRRHCVRWKCSSPK